MADEKKAKAEGKVKVTNVLGRGVHTTQGKLKADETCELPETEAAELVKKKFCKPA